jgi:hypothetical protein
VGVAIGCQEKAIEVEMAGRRTGFIRRGKLMKDLPCFIFWHDPVKKNVTARRN